MDLIVTGLLLPLVRWVTPLILAQGEIPLLSGANLSWLVQHHPGVLVILLGEGCLLTWSLVALLVLALVGISLAQNHQLRLGSWGHRTGQIWRQQGLRGWLFWWLVLLVISPIASFVLRTPLWLQVRLPAMLSDFLTRHAGLLGGTVLLWSGLVYLLARLVAAGPALLTPGRDVPTALRAAWRGRPAGRLCGQWLLLMVGLAIVAWSGNGLLVGLQGLADQLPAPVALIISRVILVLIQSGNVLLGAGALAIGTQLAGVPAVPVKDRPTRPARLAWLLALASGGMVMLATSVAGDLLPSAHLHQPRVIAHRGVDDQNGVQNTLPALARTSRRDHPAAVEMDVHETRDRQFVVVHDENLRHLTRRRAAPGQLTRREITRLSAHENGQRAPIVAFDTYLSAAEAAHQPLLVELKTSRFDQPGMARRFARQYGRRLTQDHDQVHSMNDTVVRVLRHQLPRVSVLSIQPYDLGQPQSGPAGYSMEFSSLSPAFVAAVHRRGQVVYAWTVNDPRAMRRLQVLRVDGIITDQAARAQRTLRTNQSASLARQLWLILVN